MGSFSGRPYRFNSMKIRLGMAMIILQKKKFYQKILQKLQLETATSSRLFCVWKELSTTSTGE